MSNEFPIFEVPVDDAQAEEAMGTKPKFWFRDARFGKCLFKQARSNTGEDWSEKIAAELAQLLGLPHASYELATWDQKAGTISPVMIPEDCTLIHGNDILARVVSNYPRYQGYAVSQHTLDTVLQVMTSSIVQMPLNWTHPDGITTALDTFVGYLLLDAWIGNSDRHHENWGLVATVESSVHLAPTYDHASSLGRELLDEKRRERIDNDSVTTYINRARSAFYAQSGDKKALPTLDVFFQAAQRDPNAAMIWLNQLENISSTDLRELLTRIPSERISTVALEFAHQILNINRSRLLRFREELL
jgi:HipA-like C-terminal domain